MEFKHLISAWIFADIDAMGPGNELSFVTASMILESPDRLHVVVNTTDTAATELLKEYNTSGVNLEIEYSTDIGVEE